MFRILTYVMCKKRDNAVEFIIKKYHLSNIIMDNSQLILVELCATFN